DNGRERRSERDARATSNRLGASEASTYAAGSRLRREPAAVSSRGPGRSPLKAQTRVRIPLPLFVWPVRLSVRTAPFHGAERGSIPLRATWENERQSLGSGLVRVAGGMKWSGRYEGGASAQRERLQIDLPRAKRAALLRAQRAGAVAQFG